VNHPHPRGGSAPSDDSGSEAVDTLLDAITRAGPPWSFVPVRELGRTALDPADDATPVFRRNGQLLGLVVRHPGGSDRHDELIRVLLRTARTLEHAEAARRAAERRAEAAEAAARIDALTGLPNQRAWFDALRRETRRQDRSGRNSAVLVLDLDGLKATNDTRGHPEGDRLLCTTAEVLRTSVRGSDIVARLGGDEFGVLAVDVTPASPGGLADRVRHALGAAGIQASVGAKLAGPTDELSAAFAEADRRMYLDKQRRKATGAEVHDLRMPERPWNPTPPDE